MRKAIAAFSDDQPPAKWHERVKGLEEDIQRQEDRLKAARHRWGELDRYKRRILALLSEISRFDSLEHLGQLAGIEDKYMPGHWRKLTEAGFIIEREGSFEVNPYISDLLQNENRHALAVRYIHSDGEIVNKPIFNSGKEYEVYSHLVQIFPNYLVFPNMALQAIFQYSRMKELVDKADFQYYLMAMVDFCITSTVSYMPILAVEVDSHYHEDPQQQERDRKKDRVFERGGVPLLRVRVFGQPTAASLRNQLTDAIETLLRASGGDDKHKPFDNLSALRAMVSDLQLRDGQENPSVRQDP